jgi:hypothetical protein
MRISRRKVSVPYQELTAEIDRLLRLDARNQRSNSSGSSTGVRLSRHQLHLITESVFFAAFRAYEGFLSDIFQLYCLEKRPRSGRKVKSFLRPKDFDHAGELIKSSMHFLDWTSPATVIKRAETYLDDGFPVKLPYTTHQAVLQDLKRLRNHIAHNSKESLDGYKTVLRGHFGTLPLTLPSPGEFLLLTNRTDSTKYNLIYYLELIKLLAMQLT